MQFVHNRFAYFAASRQTLKFCSMTLEHLCFGMKPVFMFKQVCQCLISLYLRDILRYEKCNVDLKKREAHKKDFQSSLTFPLFIEMAMALSYIFDLQFFFIDSRYFIVDNNYINIIWKLYLDCRTMTEYYETTFLNDMIEISVILRYVESCCIILNVTTISGIAIKRNSFILKNSFNMNNYCMQLRS